MNSLQSLNRAKTQLREAEAAWKLDLWNEDLRLRYQEAREQLLIAERRWAASEGRPHAVKLSLVGWEPMAEELAIVGGPCAWAIVFGGQEKGTQIIIDRPKAISFSSVSDETISGHPLFGYGLDSYGAFTVVNSVWVAELQKTDKVHPQHDSSHWDEVRHYMFCFKDRLVEAVTNCSLALHSYDSRHEALRASEKLYA